MAKNNLLLQIFQKYLKTLIAISLILVAMILYFSFNTKKHKINPKKDFLSMKIEKGVPNYPGFRYISTKTYVCEKIKQNVREYLHIKTGMLFVLLSGGEFMMGNQNGLYREKPGHKVELSAYLISKTEVTQKVWKKIMGDNPSHFKGDNLPVEQVSWYDCQKFCKKVGVKLPTEAQWEYACRGGSSYNYCYGNDEGKLINYGWFQSNSNKRSHPVGKKKPNAYGLYDMHGNLWEWCADWFDEYYYRESSKKDPVGPVKGRKRVVRGGSWWYGNELYLRSSFRTGLKPYIREAFLGLRLVKSIEEMKTKN